MNWLDIVIVIALIVSIISGFVNGLIRSLFSLAGLVFGVWLAGRYYVSLADRLGFISNETAARVVAFIIILVIVMIIASIAGIVVSKLVSLILLGWLDHLGGAVFGLVFGAIIIGLIMALWVHFEGPNDIITGSALASFLLDKVPLVLNLLPSEFNSIKSYFR